MSYTFGDKARRAAPSDPGYLLRSFQKMMSEAQYGYPGPINQSRPNTDPRNQTAASLLSFNNTARLIVGTITDLTAIVHVYRVQFEKAKQPTTAIYGPRTTCSVSGPRDLTTLQPGTPVLCVWHEQMPHAVIVAVLIQPNTQGRLALAAVLLNSTRNRVDEAHKLPLRMVEGGQIQNSLAGRPFDSTCAGEAGWITETGVRIFIDSWMALLGADESCQLTAFYHDQLMRLAAYNHQLWTVAREHESMNDQDEVLDWLGIAVYPWEQMGRFTKGDPSILKSAQEWQLDQPWYGKMEPKDDWCMPWHRFREFHGYLGQGGKTMVQGPAPGGDHTCYVDGQGVAEALHPGQLDVVQTLDGRLLMQSAKGISIAKRAAIPSPVRRRRPEQPGGLGDDQDSYKFSGLTGPGPAHRITGDVTVQADEINLSRALGILDLHAYFFNYAGVHPFFYHDKDYKLYEESALKHAGGKSCDTPPFSELAGIMYLDGEPFKKTWRIDHRYEDQDFYTLQSGIDLLDDGGVVIYDGYGGEIRMTAGSLFISAPGDVWLKAGRNTNVWAGWDAVTRAKNSVDITATEHDVRLKAERNMQLSAGNDKIGGVLIESRAEGSAYDFDELGEKVISSGIMLKAKNSDVVAWSSNIYLRTGGGDVKPGIIYLDAALGTQPIFTTSQAIISYLETAHVQHFGVGDVRKTNIFSESGTLLAGGLQVAGGAIIAGEVAVRGNIVVAQGHIATEKAKSIPFVGALDDPGLSKVYGAAADVEQAANQTQPQSGITTWARSLTPAFYAEKRPGNDDLITKAEFSLRQLIDYRTQDFKLYEDRWQHMGRITGKAPKTWIERPVICQGTPTYPYPGREKFEDTVLYTQDLEIFDLPAAHSKDRGVQPNLSGPYQDPKLAAPQHVSLNQYRVVR